MKNIKGLVSILLALVMILAMAIPTFAAEETGTITINNPIEDQTYSIYQMFTLESYDEGAGAYSYKITDEWKAFVEEGAGKDYFGVSTQGYVTLNKGVTVEDNSEEAAAIAKAALTYAKANNIEAVATLPDGDSYTASELPLGYYLVDSSLGALCGLTTTKPGATVNEKNTAPSLEKEVKEDSTGEWGETNDADFGQTVEFRTTITVQPGAQNYVLHDDMSAGLDFVVGSIKVTVDNVDVENYTLAETITDGCDFEISFTDEYVAGLTAGTQIVVSYSAILNTSAVVGGDGNPNETWLDYGDNNHTTHDFTKTYTYSFDVVKTNKDNAILTGAKFKLYDAMTDGNEIKLVKNADGTYRVAVTDEEKATAVEIEAGHATIRGLDSATYYLEETQQPAGYNKLSERKEVVINGANLEAEVTNGTAAGAVDTYVNGGVQVVNLTGAELPSTGGTGTTIFYIVGGILLVGAGVLLVVRKRMSTVKESK